MLIIGIAGGTGSGKSTVSNALQAELGESNVALIPQDAYYAHNPHLLPSKSGLNKTMTTPMPLKMRC